MTLQNQFWLILFDKVLIGLLILLSGFLLNFTLEKWRSIQAKNLEEYKQNEAFLRVIGLARSEAYERLWKFSDAIILEGNDKKFQSTGMHQGDFMYFSNNVRKSLKQLLSEIDNKKSKEEIYQLARELQIQIQADLRIN